jgi:hypothetical protein
VENSAPPSTYTGGCCGFARRTMTAAEIGALLSTVHSAAEFVGRVEGAENVSRFHDKHLPIADIEIINFFVCRRATKVGPFPV